MEPDQVMCVGVILAGTGLGLERFYARMRKDGRLMVPKLTLRQLQGYKEQDFAGDTFEVQLEPSWEDIRQLGFVLN